MLLYRCTFKNTTKIIFFGIFPGFPLKSYKKFYEEYEKAETAREKEILFLRREITTLEENEENKNIIKFYKDRLVSYGVMRKIKDDCKTSTKYIRNK